MNSLKASDFRRMGRETMQGNFGMIFLVLLIGGAIISALAFTVIGSIIVAGPLAVGMAIVLLALTRKESAELGDMFNGFKTGFADNLIAGLLVAIFTFLWSLLLIVPGIIKGYSYSMTTYILADNPGMPAMEAIKRSQDMMNGNKWRFFCLQFSFIGWLLLCGITFGLAYIYVGPYMTAAQTAFYNELKKDFDGAPMEGTVEG